MIRYIVHFPPCDIDSCHFCINWSFSLSLTDCLNGECHQVLKIQTAIIGRLFLHHIIIADTSCQLLVISYIGADSTSANPRHWTNVGSMLGRRRRRRANIDSKLVQCLVFVGTGPEQTEPGMVMTTCGNIHFLSGVSQTAMSNWHTSWNTETDGAHQINIIGLFYRCIMTSGGAH